MVTSPRHPTPPHLLPHPAGGKARIEANEGVRAKLANIMSYHVVRPVPGYEAFTTPFMGQGTELQVGTGDVCGISPQDYV